MSTQGKIPLTRIYRKISAKTGGEYFVGRLGSARLLIFRERDQPEGNDEVFAVFLEAVEDAPHKHPSARSSPPRSPFRRDASADIVKDNLDDLLGAG